MRIAIKPTPSPRSLPRAIRRQAGVALLVALFALLLLSAIGMAMMFNANTETSIASNYREIQIAQMGAYSGLWEARDRLRYDTSTTSSMVQTYNSSGYMTVPAGIPSTSSANVFYIINPKGGETVAPWDYSNAYADSELCHEGVLGLTTSGNGVPCSGSSSLPSGTAWYTSFDDSSYGKAYQLTNPLSFKWARIQLKTTDSASYAIGAGSSGTMVCWDGTNQIPQPAGYNSNCGPTPGAISAITLTNAGTGYTSAPTVTLSGGGGSGATATANVNTTSAGIVSSVTVTAHGSGYTSAPTVVFSGPGINATATAVLGTSGGGAIQTASLNSGSSTGCWTSIPSPATATINNPGSGTGAVITTNFVHGSCIAGITLSGSCNFHGTDTGTLTGGSGSGAQVSVSTKGNGSLQSYSMTAGGSGYTGSPTGITMTTGGNTCTLTYAPSYGYVVSTASPFTVTTAGTGYSSTSPPTVTITNPPSGLGTGGTGTTTVSSGGPDGTIASITLNSGGSGYTTAPTLTFTGGGGTGLAATAAVTTSTTTVITGITVTNAGSGYTSAPTVAISGGGGTGAAATASLSGGTYYGQVFLITSLAKSTGGARYMAQMEAVTPVRGMASTGALTFDGPSPNYSDPNSNNFNIIGTDANSCGGTAVQPKPAIGVYDNPNNPTTPSAQSTVTGDLSRPDHVYGAINPGPDVENVYNTLSSTMSTPSGLEAFGSAVNAVATANGTSYTNPSSINLGSSSNPVVDYVSGDLSLSGNNQGYGILFVTGTLTFGGNFSWNGPIYVVGKGDFEANGGGNGQITGSILVAVTRTSPYGPSNVISDSTGLGSPTVNWNGGGGNGIQYDHCWVDNLLSRIPFTPPPVTTPLKVVSVKSLQY
ncbi:MAG: hypothetical protein ACRD3E_02130 [Terriglobales bacterium]